MIIVGCDFGLRKSGIVALNESYDISEQSLIKVNSSGAERLYEIEQVFNKLLEPYVEEKSLHIFLEGYAYGAKYQRESLAELGGVMRRYFHVNSLDYWVIPPTSVKLFVTGSGKASKNYMKKCTKEKWGRDFRSDDECDAHGLARVGVSVISALNGLTSELLPEEATVVEDILNHRDHYQNGNTAKRSKTPRRQPRQKATNDPTTTKTKS